MIQPPTIDKSRNNLITNFGKAVLQDRYMIPKEKSPQESLARAAVAFADSDAHAKRLYDYASKLWFMFSTPILSNGGTNRGLPISCFLNYVPDSREGLGEHYLENIWLSSSGGGIGGYWGDIRSQDQSTSKGNKTTGVIPFMHVVDSQMVAFNQGSTRRGSYASYMDISHPEIIEFIEMRKASGGDINRKNMNLHHAVNIPDKFMKSLEKDEMWKLIDPHNKKVIREIKARHLWIKLLETRVNTGEPYIMFIDTVNKYLPKELKKLGLKVHHSNLCSEITLPTNQERTAVCCLSSVNLEYYDEWKDDPQFIDDLMRMLDNVLTYFIRNAPSHLWRAVASAKAERSVGLGAMGFHSYLQRIGIALNSPMSFGINKNIFKHMYDKALESNLSLGKVRGEPSDLKGTGKRFAHMIAIAPNASSSIICGGVSPSIEPLRANAFTQKTMSGSFLVKNKYLEKLLEKKGLNTKDVWKKIIANKGSVYHMDSLSIIEKNLFRTAIEIDQVWLVDLAAERQKYICQSQSLNLFFPPDANVRRLSNIHRRAWDKGLKTLYYCRSEAIKRAENISVKVERKVREDSKDEEDCIMCQA
jgi:ribonucleoside-diphosphate reductase alpha chain|tara:strand:- start:114 stop:1874 length:1761 start_codon:yes stop_codon:yes gene_type:complete